MGSIYRRKWKDQKMIIIFLIILGCLVLIFSMHLYATFFVPKYFGISVGDIVLIITAGSVFWYAWETRQIRKEQTAPFISVLFQTYDLEEGTDRIRFLIRNYGKGTATNITFLALQPIDAKVPTFREIEVLPPGHDELLTIEKVDYDNGKETQVGRIAQSDFLNHIKYRIDSDKFLFELKYKNIIGDNYASKGAFEQSIPGTWVLRRAVEPIIKNKHQGKGGEPD
jgi:hypothetical protein